MRWSKHNMRYQSEFWNNLSYISVNYFLHYITPQTESKTNDKNYKSNLSGQCTWPPELVICTGADDIEVGDEGWKVGAGGSRLEWGGMVK